MIAPGQAEKENFLNQIASQVGFENLLANIQQAK